MATIRMAASAGAALIALMAVVPAASPAQAPLQLVPGANQAKRVAPVATAKTTKAANNKNTASKKSPNKAAQAAASRKNARQAVAAAPSSPKTVRTSSKKTANNSVASRRQGEAKTNVQRARAANSQRVARTAVSEPSAGREPDGTDTAHFCARRWPVDHRQRDARQRFPSRWSPGCRGGATTAAGSRATEASRPRTPSWRLPRPGWPRTAVRRRPTTRPARP